MTEGNTQLAEGKNNMSCIITTTLSNDQNNILEKARRQLFSTKAALIRRYVAEGLARDGFVK